MNKIIMMAWIIAILAWAVYLVLFLLSFTDMLPHTAFSDFPLITGLGLFIFTGLILIAYQKQIKHQKDMKNPTIREF
jgi:FtsH-binding integral membrane protein